VSAALAYRLSERVTGERRTSGSFHCATLDIRRRGSLQNYF
jgi:hypothetical protein